MSTFTKGPYRVARSDDECTEEWSLDGPGSYAYLPIVSGTKLIACVRGDLIDESFETAPEMEATANLIAAAPDMFEALKTSIAALKFARAQLREYEIALNGEDYNSPTINIAIDGGEKALLRALISQSGLERATPVSDTGWRRMRLKVEDVRISEEFCKMAKACKAPLPWNVDDLGRVHDARGLVIMDLHIAGAQDALDCAHLIVLAVNTCGGFKAVSDTGGAGRPSAPKADVGGEA